MTHILCSECGEGTYAPRYLARDKFDTSAPAFPDYARCASCGHEAYVPSDIARYLDEGESVAWVDGILSVRTELPELSLDEAEALGLDGTGRDGDPRFPYTFGGLTDPEA